MKKNAQKFFLGWAIIALTATFCLADDQASKKQIVSNGDNFLTAINDHLNFSGVVEVEANFASAFDKSKSSDIALATVEIALDSKVSEWSSAHLLLKYEGGEEESEVFVDEGTIMLGNMEKLPVSLTAGKMYIPFGIYNSNMITDPLPLEIGETNDNAVHLSAEIAGFYSSVYFFNGKTDEIEKNDYINTLGLNVGYAKNYNTFTIDVGIDWINNMANTNGMADYISTTSGTVIDTIAGVSIHAIFETSGFLVTGEYLTALDNFAPDELAFAGQGAKPSAYNIEIANDLEIVNRQTTFALGWQGTDEALNLGLPESRIIASVSMEFFPATILTLEYLYDEDYSSNVGGTNDDAQTITMQLAYEF